MTTHPYTATRILVVEDESLVRELIVEVLTEAGFEVDQANSADQAEELLILDGYKLLVTDVHMPGKLNGLELALRSLQREPDLPILVVTARSDVLVELKGQVSPVSYITKPFSLVKMVATAKRLIAEAHEAESQDR